MAAENEPHPFKRVVGIMTDRCVVCGKAPLSPIHSADTLPMEPP